MPRKRKEGTKKATNVRRGKAAPARTPLGLNEKGAVDTPCPTCQGGRRYNGGANCPLCKGKKTIKSHK